MCVQPANNVTVRLYSAFGAAISNRSTLIRHRWALLIVRKQRGAKEPPTATPTTQNSITTFHVSVQQASGIRHLYDQYHTPRSRQSVVRGAHAALMIDPQKKWYYCCSPGCRRLYTKDVFNRNLGGTLGVYGGSLLVLQHLTPKLHVA